MKFITFLIAFVFFLPDGEYKHVASVELSETQFMTTDHFGNAYTISGNQFRKYDKAGKLQHTFSEDNRGTLRWADVTNPLKILLFFPDFARVILLDSRLAEHSVVNFREIGINQPLTACHSEDECIWIYDREDDQLKKIDRNLQVVQQSGSLLQQLGYQIVPDQMLEKNGFVYVNNPATGILVFDRYATYYKTLPYPMTKNFQVVEKDVLFVYNNKLYRYNSKDHME